MLLHEIKASNLLSFGPEGIALQLQPLNVLIGPNGSGKSNILEIIDVLRVAPTNWAAHISERGGIYDWIWKGQPEASASIDAIVDNPLGATPLRHIFEFANRHHRFELISECIEDAFSDSEGIKQKPYYANRDGQAVLQGGGGKPRPLLKGQIFADRSIISQRKDPENFAELTYLGDAYSLIKLYREWSFGRQTPVRLPQKADQPNDMLAPDCTNLGLVLNRLRRDAAAKRLLLESLTHLYPGIEDFDVSIEGGTVQVFFQESGYNIPATRLSDGTLRYLCLLAVLCHPTPPPLVCIEEPELGLHPDVLPKIADLLIAASARTQLIVTTHSDILVDALTERPEAVVVVEKQEGQTTARRLQAAELTEWLKKYRLGQLWTRGQLGGTRW